MNTEKGPPYACRGGGGGGAGVRQALCSPPEKFLNCK